MAFDNRNRLRAIVGFATIVVLIGCSGEHLVPLKRLFAVSGLLGTATVNFCTDAPAPLNIEHDYFFIIDTSNRNTTNCITNPGNYSCGTSIGNTTSGSNVLSSVNGTSGVQVGMSITGTGIPSNQTVTAVAQNSITFGPGVATSDNAGVTFTYPPTIEPGSNPNSTLTFGAISTFLGQILQIDPNDPNNYFSLGEFNSLVTFSDPSAAKMQDAQSFLTGGYKSLSSNFSGFQALVQSEGNAKAYVGWSDYSTTLTYLQNSIIQMLGNENPLAPVKHSIEIIFMSSGLPLVTSNNQVVEQDFNSILNQVSSLESLTGQPQYAPYLRSLTFNTVYYWVVNGSYSSMDPSADALLKQMAANGDGHYYPISLGQVPDFSTYVLPRVNDPYLLSDIFVHDMNVAWSGPDLDTASDGLMSDMFRTSHGASTALVQSGNPDCDGNGVSDLVEFTSNKGSISNSPTCDPNGATQYQNSICGAFVLPASTPGHIQYSHNILPNSVFNDCELKLLNANLDGTGLILGTSVPQDIAAVMFDPMALQAPTTWLSSSPFNDVYTGYQRIKYDIDTLVSTNDIIDLVPYQYQLTYTGENTNLQSCYTAIVSNIRLSVRPNDTIRVYIVESGAQSNASKVRSAAKQVAANGTVTFADSDLK